MKKAFVVILLFQAAGAGMWNPPLTSTGYSFIMSHWGLQGKPGFLLSLIGSARLGRLTFTDEKDETTSTSLTFKPYPELGIAARFKKLGFYLREAEVLDAGGFTWDEGDVRRSLRLYRLSLAAAWWPLPVISISAGYNHNLGWLSWEEPYDSATLKMFGHAPGFSAGFSFKPTGRLLLNAVAEIPSSLSLMGEKEIRAEIRLPISLEGQAHLAATDRFDLALTVSYTFSSVMDSLELPQDYDGPLPLCDRNTLGLEVGTGYRLLDQLTLRLWGAYSSKALSSLDPAWPNPGTLAVALEGTWNQGPWRFSALIGQEMIHPLSSVEVELLSTNIYIFRLGITLEL